MVRAGGRHARGKEKAAAAVATAALGPPTIRRRSPSLSTPFAATAPFALMAPMRTTPARREKCRRVSCVVRKRNIKLDGEGVVGHGPSAVHSLLRGCSRFIRLVAVTMCAPTCNANERQWVGAERERERERERRGCSYTRTVAFKDNLLAICACEADSCGRTRMHSVRLAWLHGCMWSARGQGAPPWLALHPLTMLCR
jgi:hypothetical protein